MAKRMYTHCYKRVTKILLMDGERYVGRNGLGPRIIRKLERINLYIYPVTELLSSKGRKLSAVSLTIV